MAVTITYRNFFQGLKARWLQGPIAQAYLGALGDWTDEYVGLFKEATKASFPEVAPVDALPAIAAEMRIVPGAGETDAHLATRLRKVWDTQWCFAGSALGMLYAIHSMSADYAVGNIYIIQQNGLAWSLSALNDANPAAGLVVDTSLFGSNYYGMTDGPWSVSPWFYLGDGPCSRFVVLFDQATSGDPSTWTSPADPPTASSLPPKSEINVLRGIVRRWKPASVHCDSIILWVSGHIWGEPGPRDWGSGNWEGVSYRWSPELTP